MNFYEVSTHISLLGSNSGSWKEANLARLYFSNLRYVSTEVNDPFFSAGRRGCVSHIKISRSRREGTSWAYPYIEMQLAATKYAVPELNQQTASRRTRAAHILGQAVIGQT
jgi:hypothetical protein